MSKIMISVNLHLMSETEIKPRKTDQPGRCVVVVSGGATDATIFASRYEARRLISALEASLQMDNGCIRQCDQCGDSIDHERPEVTICLACENA